MEHLLTNVTGLDMALGLLLVLIYVWPCREENGRGLDSEELD